MSILRSKHSGWTFEGRRTPFGGGGKGGGGGGGQQQTTAQSNQYANLSPWAQPYVTSLLGAAQQQVFQTKQNPATEGYWTDSAGNKVDAATAQADQGFHFGGGGGQQYNYNAGNPASTEITGINPYNAYGAYNPATGGQYGMTPSAQMAANAAVAGFTPLQQQAYQGAANLRVPGQYGTAANFAETAGRGAMDTVGQAAAYGSYGSNYGNTGAAMSGNYGAMGAQAGAQNANLSNIYGGTGVQAGQQYAGQSSMYGGAGAMQGQQGAAIGQSLGQMSTNPNAVGAYMNPYLQNSLQPQLNLLAQQGGIQGAAQQGAATQSGAFGGSRSTLANSLAQQNNLLAQQQAIGQGYNTAFNTAQQQMNVANQAALAGNQQALSGYGMGLQGAGQAGNLALAGNAQGLQGAQQAGQLGIAGAQAGLQGAQQYGQLGIAGAQAGLAGVQGQQAGLNLLGQQGMNLSSIAGQQLGAQQGILGIQNQYGGQQQQQAQNIINAGMTNYQTAQQYPMNQLQQLSNLAVPYITKDITTTQQTAQPSTATQLAGLGTAGVAGLALASKAAEGGLMKGYAAGGAVKFDGGGIAALNRKALLSPESMSPKTLQRSTQNGAIAPQVSGIAKAIQLNEQVNSKNAEALNQNPPQGTIMDELEAKASQMDQAQAMQEIIPKAMAVLKHKMDKAVEEGDVPLAQKYAAELQQLTQIIQQQASTQETPSAPAPEGIQQLAPEAGQVAQTQPGIETATSNLPTQTMAEGGIVGYAKGGSAKVMQDVDEEEALAAEDQMYGSGIDNDFIQSIMPAAAGRSPHPSAAISIRTDSEAPIKGAKGTHKYEADVIKEAKRIGLPPEIAVHSLYKETGNLKDPETARSRAGALGVMQLMPATAKELGVNPLNPIENIQGGVGYLKKLYDKYQDPQLTLMAYNAGPGRVDRALKSAKGIESLPHETLAYRKAAGGVVGYSDGGGIDTIGAELDALRSGEETLSKAAREGGSRRPADPEIIAAYENAKKERALKEKEYQDLLSKAGVDKPALMPQYSMQPKRPVPNPVVQAQSAVPPTPQAQPAPVAVAQPQVAPPQVQPQIQPQPSIAAPAVPAPLEAAPAPKSFMDQLAAEMMQDIRSRKEDSKKTREQNNLLALMQAGLGMAASRNISPLGAIGEGGMQGVGALAQYRKQEGEEAKDIGAQQLGMYRFAGTAEQNKVLNEIKNAQLGLKQTGSSEKVIQAARDDLNQFEKTRTAALAKRFPMGELDPKYKAALAEIYNDPKYKALESIAYPSLAQPQGTGGGSNIIRFDEQGKQIKG